MEYYVYAYLDPRKSESQYENWVFSAEPFYIGMGKGDRKEHHLREINYKHKSNIHKTNKIKGILREKYLPLIFICKENLSESEAKNLEQLLIRLIGRKDFQKGPLLNHTDGGDGLCNPSEETRKKISQNHGEYPSGEENIFYGKNAWIEWGRECSKETRKKLAQFAERNGMFGKHHTPEWCEQHSQQMVGEGNPNFGKLGSDSPNFGRRNSDETKQRMAEKARKVPCVIGGNSYPSIKEAARILGVGYYAARGRAKREVQ